MSKTIFFPEALRGLREKAGLTQVELSRRAGLADNHIAQFESGNRLPSYQNLRKLAAALGVSLAEFDAVEAPEKS